MVSEVPLIYDIVAVITARPELVLVCPLVLESVVTVRVLFKSVLVSLVPGQVV